MLSSPLSVGPSIEFHPGQSYLLTIHDCLPNNNSKQNLVSLYMQIGPRAEVPKCECLRLRSDRLCGLVVRVLGYRSGGPGSIPGTTRKKK
jgi:hypothetical protein